MECHDISDRTAATADRQVPAGLLLQWHVTNRCNLRCQHCYQDSYGGDELTFEELVGVLESYEQLLREWRTAAGNRGVRGHITVTGGEPFVRKDFLPFLTRLAARRDQYSFAILTNGSLIDLRIARQLRALRPRFVQLSVEGTETTHDAIRGRGDFARTVAALRTLRRFRVPTMVSFTAHRRNYREFAAVADLSAKLGVRRVWSDRLIPAVAKPGLSGTDALSPTETREYFGLMAEAKRRIESRWFNRTEIAMHRALQFLIEGDKAYRCTAGDTLITVMPNGDVYPCRRMPIRVGNVRETPLGQIYAESPVLARLRNPEAVSAGCEGCDHIKRCRGGLKCLSYATTGNPHQRDPGCWL